MSTKAGAIQFLESCRPRERFRIIEMAPMPTRVEATYHAGGAAAEGVVGDCLEELAAGGRVWLAVESKTRAAVLGEFFVAQGYRALAITAENKNDACPSAFLADPDVESRQYDVIVASPVIGSGISVQHEDPAGQHFTLSGFIGAGQRITPADAAQMMARVRYVRRYTLGLLANSRVGQHGPDAILRAWQEAAAAEGAPSKVDDFAAFVAGIRADDLNLRNDFAAGLLWQLDAAGWVLRRATSDHAALGLSEPLRAIKDAQAEERRVALLAAPVIDFMEARRLERLQERTRSQDATLVAHGIRRTLGVETLDSVALEFWDEGAGIRRLDRFSAFRGVVPAFNDSAENLARRRYSRATAKAYRDLFAGFDLTRDRITEKAADIILDRMIANRFLLAHLQLAPASYGTWEVARDGRLLPFRRPKNARQEVAALLERMGLRWRRREGTATHTPAETTLGLLGEGVGKPKRTLFYQVTAESVAEMQLWADRRDAARSTTQALGVDDEDYWRGVRMMLLEQAQGLTREQAACIVLDRVAQRGRSAHAWLTAQWLLTDLGARLTP